MAVLVSSIITDAFRERNILALRKKAPTALQTTEALRLFNALIAAIYGGDAGEELGDWPLGTYGRESKADPINYTQDQLQRPTINRRLIAVNTTALTVYLTVWPQDGARMGIADPFGRLAAFPGDAGCQRPDHRRRGNQNTQHERAFQEWFYRADLGQWVKLSALTEIDNLPFPDEFRSFFILMLAMRLNPRYGRSMDEQSAAIFKQGRTSFVARYLQSMPLEIDDSISWPFMSMQSYDQQRQFSSSQDLIAAAIFIGELGMADIPLAKSDYFREVAKEARITMRNRYFEENPVLTDKQSALIARMGMRRWIYVGDGPIRNVYSQPGSFSDALFVASYDKLWRVSTTGVVTLIGDIPSNSIDGFVSMAATNNIGTTRHISLSRPDRRSCAISKMDMRRERSRAPGKQ